MNIDQKMLFEIVRKTFILNWSNKNYWNEQLNKIMIQNAQLFKKIYIKKKKFLLIL